VTVRDRRWDGADVSRRSQGECYVRVWFRPYAADELAGVLDEASAT
jgi:hypothetical protein